MADDPPALAFEELLLNDVPLMDTRAPVEFAKGSFPSAVNLPLMSDDERAAVGTCYKQQGPEAAVALGHRLVSGEVKAQRLAAWTAFTEQHPHGALFCFRGGMRSAIVQQWLLEAGIHYPRVTGGYKAMRRWLIDELERLCNEHAFIVVSGKTGVAKTRLLNEGNWGQPLPGAIDLEGLACHRGSAFGRRVQEQPSQISFETALAIALLKRARAHTGPLLLEDESRLIGRCALPLPLQRVIQQAPMVLVDAPLAARVRHTHENYILANLQDFELAAAQSHTDQAIAFGDFATSLREALSRIRRRLGGDRYGELQAQLNDALTLHEGGDPSGHCTWIETLLRDYYDPMYEYQLTRKSNPVLFKGDYAAVADYLAAHQSA